MSIQSNGVLNLDVIDDAYGKWADLYADVLEIRPTAGPGQIHDAYFARRDALYKSLASMESGRSRREAERRMDAVVCAIRVLGDPDLRAQYDGIRTQRMMRRRPRKDTSNDGEFEAKSRSMSYSMDTEPSSPGAERRSPVGIRKGIRITTDTVTRGRRRKNSEWSQSSTQRLSPSSSPVVVTPDKIVARASSQSTIEKRDDMSQSYNSSSDDDEVTMMTVETYDVPRRPKGFLDRVRAEVVGALDDTSRSFEQVFNAFTLREEDIQAVVGKIDKVKIDLASGNVKPNGHAADSKRQRSRSSARKRSPSKARRSRR